MEKSGLQLVKRNWRRIKSSFFPVISSSEKEVKEIDGNGDRVEKGTIKQILVFAVTMLDHN